MQLRYQLIVYEKGIASKLSIFSENMKNCAISEIKQ